MQLSEMHGRLRDIIEANFGDDPLVHGSSFLICDICTPD